MSAAPELTELSVATSPGLRNARTDRTRRWLLWPGFLFLVFVGIAVAAIRAWAIATGRSAFEGLASFLPAVVVEEGTVSERWYASHGLLTALHILPGSVLLFLVPLQFVKTIRRRYPSFHRWLGRSLLIIAAPTVLTGLLIGGLSPFSGVVADVAIALFGGLFVVALVRGYRAARRRDFVHHREWMLRMVSIAVGIATVRVVALPIFWLTGARPLDLVGPTFWTGLALSYATAEIWIRYTRVRPAANAR